MRKSFSRSFPPHPLHPCSPHLPFLLLLLPSANLHPSTTSFLILSSPQFLSSPPSNPPTHPSHQTHLLQISATPHHSIMTDSDQIHNNDSLFESNFSEQPGDAPEKPQPSFSEEDLSKSQLTLRCLVTSKEAGVIIGKAGKNVADLREQTGVKADVSKSVAGVQDRVLTVTGTLDGVSQAYSIVANSLVDSPIAISHPFALSPTPPSGIATIRLLISHQQMGAIIGRQGAKIKSIQENFKVRMVASKELLPQSTERIVEIQGKPEAIRSAAWEIGRHLLEDWERAGGTIFYVPQVRPAGTNSNGFSNRPRYNNNNNNGNSNSNSNSNSNYNGTNGNRSEPKESSNEETFQEQLPISADMVGCIIGKGGNRIAEIRHISGAKISIAKESHDSSGDRMFTIIGTREANQEALRLLFHQLENEKNRRTSEAGQQA